MSARSSGDIIRSGTLRKMKTSRKKYFVLRQETPDTLARLEYYDSEKKFRAGLPPKRSIPLRTCFNINKKLDTKHKNVIALYTKDDCFCVVFDNEEELNVWLKDFLTLQHGEEIPEGEILKPKFEYVWELFLCERGLGAGRVGVYRLCLTDKTVILVKVDEAIPTVIGLPLSTVRTCGNVQNFFYLEVGRMSEIGEGQLWLEAEDHHTALNIKTTVNHRFNMAKERDERALNANIRQNVPTSQNATSSQNADLQPKGRIRSASATESSKSHNKKYNPIMSSKHLLPQDSSTSERTLTPPVTSTGSSTTSSVSGVAMSIYNHILQRGSGKRRHSISGFRERCDSMPSRPRTSSEGNHAVPGWGKPYLVPYRTHHLRDASHSPPTGSPISPPSDSTGSSYSLTDEHDGLHDMEHQRMYSTLTPEEVIAEEDYPESPRATASGGDYMPMNFQVVPDNNYAGHNYASNSASMSSVTSGTPSTDIKLSDYPLDKVFSYVCADDDDTRPCRAYSVGSKPHEAQLASTPENARVRAFSVGSKTKKYFNRVLPSHHHPPGVKSSSAPLLAPNSRMGSSHGSINNPMDDLMEMDFSSNGTSRSRTSTNASGSSNGRSSCNHKNSSCNGAKGKFFGFLEHFGLGGDHKKSSSEGYVEMKPGPRTVSSSSSSDVTPYVDMTLGQRGAVLTDINNSNNAVPPVGDVNSPYLDMSGTGTNNVPLVGHPYSPYLDMSGNNGLNSGERTPQVGDGISPYMDMSGGNNATTRENYMDMSSSSPVRGSPRPSAINLNEYVTQYGNSRHDYMDMNQRHRANSNSSANSRTAISPGTWISDHNTDYLDMSGRNNRRSERTNSFGSQMSSSPHFDAATSPKFTDHPFGIQNRIPERTANDIDGYVQMTPGDFTNIGQRARHQRQSSTDSTDNEHGDYLNMSGMNTALTATKNDKKGRSQPIAILTASGNTGVKNSSPISISSLLGRKSSPTTGASPKMHLPLSPYSSLPRQKSPRKSSSQTNSSKDSSVNSSVTTTPSSSSTMFHLSLNSPTSPLASASKTGTPTTTSSMKVPASVLNVPYKAGGTKKKTVNSDYIMMDFETPNKVDESPYMNYCPSEATSRLPKLHSADTDDYSGDYAVMKPGIFPAKPSTLPRMKSGGSSGLTSPLANHLSSVGLGDRQSMCFMPIREKDERMCSPKPGDVPDKLVQDEKTLETANMEVEDESSRAYDRLKSPSSLAHSAAKISRPSSSNSEKIKTPVLQRPASTTGSEKNSSRPSSVCSDGLASRLGSSSSVHSSSSSTCTIVGNPTNPDEADPDQPQPQIVRMHYASLDLASSDPAEDRRSPRTLKTASSEANLGDNQGPTFVYADIDFVKSEELSRNGAGVSGSSSSSGSSAAVKN